MDCCRIVKAVLQQFLCVVDGHFKTGTCFLRDYRCYVDEKAYVDGSDRGICCNDLCTVFHRMWQFTGS